MYYTELPPSRTLSPRQRSVELKTFIIIDLIKSKKTSKKENRIHKVQKKLNPSL